MECAASSSEFNFGFAFNDSNYSDRVLRIEIMPDPVDSDTAVPDNRVRHGKRRRETIDEQQILDGNQNQDEEETVEDGDESSSNNDSIVSVKTLHISSPILAAKSPFFHKLLSNGMRESHQRYVTLKINSSEEASVMELLNFMYSNTLNVTAAPALLAVLVAADKFGVSSCVRYCCSQLLQNSPMTTDSALLYLDLPSTVGMADVVQPLIDAAEQYLAGRYKDLTLSQEEMMALSLSGIEAILASDDLQVESEDDVYDFVLKWAAQHYDKPEERQKVLSSRLVLLIRFSYMTYPKLKEVILTSKDPQYVFRAVIALLTFQQVRPLSRQLSMTGSQEKAATLGWHFFVKRAYKRRPVKVIEFDLPRQQTVVYLDLKREECAALFQSSGKVLSQTFHVGGQEFYLSAQCNMDQESSSRCFGLHLGMPKSSSSFALSYEFGARHKKTEDFYTYFKGSYTYNPAGAEELVGPINLFKGSWTSFIAENSMIFINGVLHLRADVTIKH